MEIKKVLWSTFLAMENNEVDSIRNGCLEGSGAT